MNYSDCLEYLFARLPMYQRVGGSAYKANLDNTHQLMELLEHPHRRFKTIHVAGTNGKGSTSHLLASVLQEAGYKCGLYTSPHLLDFRERVRVNGAVISEDNVVQFVEKWKQPFEQIDLSFFEWSVGLAFQHFAHEQVDVAVIEVGMGGRLDSTNVISPLLSIITNIGLDHTQYLGETLTHIAREKAGIIKSKTPVVIGQSHRETEGVFRKAALAQNSAIVFADQEFPQPVPPNPLQGDYQKVNFQTTLTAIEKLRELGFKLTQQQVVSGFANVITNTGLRGRWQKIGTNPTAIADVAHNTDGLLAVVNQLTSIKPTQLHFVLGFVNDKDVDTLLGLFPTESQFYLCQPSVPRAMPIGRLAQLADQRRLKYKQCDSVPAAYAAARHAAVVDDTIFVGGSTFVVADLLAVMS